MGGMSTPSPEAMNVAREIAHLHSMDCPYGGPGGMAIWKAESIDEAFRPLRESHERLRVACESFVVAWDKSHQLEKTEVAMRLARAALSQMPQ
jgi:hypothetical protein